MLAPCHERQACPRRPCSRNNTVQREGSLAAGYPLPPADGAPHVHLGGTGNLSFRQASTKNSTTTTVRLNQASPFSGTPVFHPPRRCSPEDASFLTSRETLFLHCPRSLRHHLCLSSRLRHHPRLFSRQFRHFCHRPSLHERRRVAGSLAFCRHQPHLSRDHPPSVTDPATHRPKHLSGHPHRYAAWNGSSSIVPLLSAPPLPLIVHPSLSFPRGSHHSQRRREVHR